MMRRFNFYSICFGFGVGILLFLAGSRFADKTYYPPSTESRRSIRTFYQVEHGRNNIMQQIPSDSNEGLPNIKEILEKTRSKIKLELHKYNFSYSGVNKLEDLLMESGGRPLRSLIISTWRSGSTFLGDVLNAVPSTFYHYEPLLKHAILQLRRPPNSSQALSTMKYMFECNFYGMDDYFNYGKTDLSQFSFNTRLWDHCKYNKHLCFDADFTSRFCKLFPFQSMKVLRVRLNLIQNLLDDKELNMRVILLVRDPRGMMQSRQHRNFCQPAPDCWQPEIVCADLVRDYVAASRLLPKYPDRLMVLRFEELALNPNATTHRILKFLRLNAMQSIDEFLQSHTKVEVPGVVSTFRISRDVPFKWKNILHFDFVDEIQFACKEAMHLWGYKMARNATHMASKEFNPIQKYNMIAPVSN